MSPANSVESKRRGVGMNLRPLFNSSMSSLSRLIEDKLKMVGVLLRLPSLTIGLTV